MTSKQNKLITLAASAVLLFARLGSAQVSAGRFTLPVETRWGTAVLPPGDYSFRLPSATLPAVVTVSGQGQKVMIMVTGGTSEHEVSDGSSLTLIRVGQKAFVRSFDLGHLGTTFFYRPPKGQEVLMAEEPELIQRVPVTVAAM